jgi:hypothetical protein
VSLIDASGAVVLQQMSRRLDERGHALVAGRCQCRQPPRPRAAQFVGQRFAADHGMPDIDQAMERAELSLLALAGHKPLREVVPMEQVSLMDGLDAAQRARLAACLQPRQLAAGEYLFRQGDPGDRLYVITAGSVDVLSACGTRQRGAAAALREPVARHDAGRNRHARRRRPQR